MSPDPQDGVIHVLVAVVTYNSAAVISECVTQLAWMSNAQGIEARLVVTDNDSSDDTLAHLRRLAGQLPAGFLQVVPSPENRGWGAGNNLAIGARERDPHYVLLCNPDAFIDEDNFRALLAGLRANQPRAAIAVPFLDGPDGIVLGANPEWGRLRYFVGDFTSGRRGFQRFQARYRGRRGSFDIPDAYASGALALIDFPSLREAGFFDERIFMFNDDIDMTRRVLSRGHTLLGVGEAHGHHIGGRGSQLEQPGTTPASLSYESDLVFVEKWYGRRWARLVAAYRWYVSFPVLNAGRRLTGRRADLEALRAPAGRYLRTQRKP